jgi:hypothetical protein
MNLGLLRLVSGFGSDDWIRGGNESRAVEDSRIISDFGDLFRVSLNPGRLIIMHFYYQGFTVFDELD